LRVRTNNPIEISQRLCALSVVHGWKIREIRPQGQTLEDLFVRLTAEEEAAAPEELGAT